MTTICPICGRRVDTHKGQAAFKSLTTGKFYLGDIPKGEKLSSKVYTVGNDCAMTLPKGRDTDRIIKMLHSL